MLDSRIANRYNTNNIVLHESEHFEQEAKIVIDLVTRWGMVAAIEDGEDSAGRQKLRLMLPVELVARAFETADLVMVLARSRGLVHIGPSMEDLEKLEKLEKKEEQQ